jgi:hypothetical protein
VTVSDPTPIRGEGGPAWPEPLDEAAFHGLAGEVVRALLPHTEADPAALLVTFLACVGNAIGTGPHYVVSGARHELRIFPVLVGATSSGRKGTAVDTLGPLFTATLPLWWGRQQKGMVSGEGLIYHVRDEVKAKQAIKAKGIVTGYQDVIEDAGVEDKRLLIIEKEFGNVLGVLTRENNTLSGVIRDAWDGGHLATLAKNSHNRATSPHITILGHITPEELTALLNETQARNGFANRFLWVCVRRSKLLPHGGDLDEGTVVGLSQMLEAAIDEARGLGRLRLNDDARASWERVYEPLSTGEPGVIGALLSRGAPMVLRLACVYAALDGTAWVGTAHLEAALTLWGYAEASVRHIFGLAPPAVSPYRATILAALVGGPLSQSFINDEVFGKNLRAPEPHATLNELLRAGLVEQTFQRPESGRGRHAMVWSLTEKGRQEATG